MITGYAKNKLVFVGTAGIPDRNRALRISMHVPGNDFRHSGRPSPQFIAAAAVAPLPIKHRRGEAIRDSAAAAPSGNRVAIRTQPD